MDILAPEEGYIVTGIGKSLLALTRDKSSWDSLSNYEKVFYYLRLFDKACSQLTILLRVLSESSLTGQNKLSLCYKYSQEIYRSSHVTWAKATIEDGLSLYERRRVTPKGLRTMFDCMLKWLQQLDMVTGKDITLTGRRLLDYLTTDEKGAIWFSGPRRCTLVTKVTWFGSIAISRLKRNKVSRTFSKKLK
jgi:hypothetical protein